MMVIKIWFWLVKDLLVNVKMAVFSQQTQNPEQEFQEFKHGLWYLTENSRTKVVDVQVNGTSKGHIYDTMKVVLKVIISFNPARKYVLKWDKGSFGW